MENRYRVVNAGSGGRRGAGVAGGVARSVSCLLLAGLLAGCAASSPTEPDPLPPAPSPEPDVPKEDGKTWKPVTG